jgi:hypothetical protein
MEVLIFNLTPVLPPPPTSPKFIAEEYKQFIKLRVIKIGKEKRKLPDGRKMVTKPITREITTFLHKGSHGRPQAMCDVVLRTYGCLGIYTVAKQVCECGIICKEVNKQALRKQPLRGRPQGLRPFQSTEVDYIEMSKIG